MSTSYYGLRSPLTGVRTRQVGRRTIFDLYTDAGAICGIYPHSDEEERALLLMLADTETPRGDGDYPVTWVAHVSVEGLREPLPRLPDSTTLISEEGVLTTLGNLREKWSIIPKRPEQD